MVMSDLLCKAREDATSLAADIASIDGSQPARFFTVATLTGHSIRAVGPYGCILDNGPAKASGMAQRIAKAGHLLSDPFEVSTLRREDYHVSFQPQMLILDG
jgi:leucyl aminopeptidase